MAGKENNNLARRAVRRVGFLLAKVRLCHGCCYFRHNINKLKSQQKGPAGLLKKKIKI